MGTHPIFESDFDCLTEALRNNEKHAEKKKRKSKIVVGAGLATGFGRLLRVRNWVQWRYSGTRGGWHPCVCVCGCAVNRGFKLLVTTSNGGVCNSVGRVR